MADGKKFDSRITGAGWESIVDGAKALFGTGTKATIGSKQDGQSRSGGLYGFGKSAAGHADNMVGSVMERTGNFVENRPVISLVLLTAVLWNPVKNLFKKHKVKTELKHEQQISDNIAQQVASRREQAATTSAQFGSINPAYGNVDRLNRGNGVGQAPRQ